MNAQCYCPNCREEADIEFAFAELHYTDFEDKDTFEKLAEWHGLEYVGENAEAAPGATCHMWAAADGLTLWTAENPSTISEMKYLQDGEDKVEHRGGYASYLYIDGPAGAAESLYVDIIETAPYIKGEFHPLQTETGEEIRNYWDTRDNVSGGGGPA